MYAGAGSACRRYSRAGQQQGATQLRAPCRRRSLGRMSTGPVR
jgi:hypothetical protein